MVQAIDSKKIEENTLLSLPEQPQEESSTDLATRKLANEILGKSAQAEGARRVTCPNLSLEILKAAAKKEGWFIERMKQETAGLDSSNEQLSVLMKFSQQLTKLPTGQSSHPITDEMKENLEKLRGFGIDLIDPNEGKILPDKIPLIKADIDAHKSKLNTHATHRHSQKITELQAGYNSLIDCLKSIIKAEADLIAIINRRSAKGG